MTKHVPQQEAAGAHGKQVASIIGNIAQQQRKERGARLNSGESEVKVRILLFPVSDGVLCRSDIIFSFSGE